ncbi:MerR family transcriptional regulator [Williamsia muralis]|jgi:DNA-binding transcriptional MerR regulator|uniref:MerR family transcriptional regulator n=1 Tax=Williamsia marianensis TaxID=85044 RepID=A0A315T8N6_WILMA|nr:MULTISPECIES: MerR family transcriptional regulator [Williamsia]MDV7134879.1 MerR family transcriptional regulator [Williamsia muralis]PVY27424.1 MerR-like DNA binding protein [Williamsia marianensis]RKR97006.1 MerR-like DNA binding protein [Williamsia muralis]
MAEYRINELADVSGVSVRNIRVYQDRGLLPPPKIKGRTGWYSAEHLSRLKVISQMLERGYTFATISELLMAARYGLKVEHVLEGEPKRGSRWKNFRRMATITISELRKGLGATDSNIALGQRLGLLVKEGAGYAVTNPEVLAGAEVLVKAGIDLDVLLTRWERVQQDLQDIAASFVSIVTDKYFEDGSPLELEESEVIRLAELVHTVRPMAHEIVEVAFSKAMDTEISKALDRGAELMMATDDEKAGVQAESGST